MIRNSLECQRILTEGGILTDVRTCVFSTTTYDDLYKIAQMIVQSGDSGKKFWTIRQYSLVPGLSWRPLPVESFKEWVKYLSSDFPQLYIGYRAKWQGGGLEFWKNGEEISNVIALKYGEANCS